MGTPDFAVPALRALHAAGHEIAAVYCQPPRPAGRGQAVRRCPVQVAAEALGLPVRTPARLKRDADEQAAFAALGLDAAVVAAYGLILPEPMLAAPLRGCLNIHASLLPRWRGAAPIQAAILAGDTQSGVTIMQMDAGLDTGAMLLQGRVQLTDATTASALHDTLAAMGAELILQALAEHPQPSPQPESGVSYAGKLGSDDGRLDWRQDAAALARRVRALNPWPGTFAQLDGERLKVLATEPATGDGAPGEILDEALLVATGAGALRLTRVQAAGRAAMPAAAFLRGRRVPVGTRLH
jgi:methionyl-tRNA formyltransferase